MAVVITAYGGACTPAHLPAGGMLGTDAGGPPPPPRVRAACLDASHQPRGLSENRAVYDQDVPDVLTIELTAFDIAALDALDRDVPGASARVIFQEGTFGAGAADTNARMEVRGATSRLAPQKSYKITLDSRNQLWRGMREINLNKQPYDLTRVRNKLAFDLFRHVPAFASLRTNFVHLFINGQDRGLYTQVEEPRLEFLVSHGLDPAGALYKAKRFSFQALDAAIVRDPIALADYLERKGAPDTEKLLAMIEDVNNRALDTHTVLARHFDRDNYMTWLAVNVLVGNFDTGAQNFFLYSPSDCGTWYFLPWDYDGSFSYYEQPGTPPRRRWRAGLANWWGGNLHRRFLGDPRNVADLQQRVESLRPLLSAGQIAGLLEIYRPLVAGILASPPDVYQLPVVGMPTQTQEIGAQWRAEYQRLASAPDALYREYQDVAERPMPIGLHTAVPGDGWLFSWEPSYDMQGDGLSYQLQIARSSAFLPEEMILDQPGLRAVSASLGRLPSGYYRWRVLVRDDKDPVNNWQVPFVLDEAVDVP